MLWDSIDPSLGRTTKRRSSPRNGATTCPDTTPSQHITRSHRCRTSHHRSRGSKGFQNLCNFEQTPKRHGCKVTRTTVDALKVPCDQHALVACSSLSMAQSEEGDCAIFFGRRCYDVTCSKRPVLRLFRDVFRSALAGCVLPSHLRPLRRPGVLTAGRGQRNSVMERSHSGMARRSQQNFRTRE